MKQFCKDTIAYLATLSGRKWAEEFVRLRMDFHRKHGYGLTQSIWHGTEFFKNVLDALENGAVFDEPKGQYRDNFNKLIKHGLSEA